MLKTAILSSLQQNMHLYELLEHYGIAHNTGIRISYFDSESSLHRDVRYKCPYDVIFLDADMEMSLELAAHIRGNLFDESTIIIMISSYENFNAEWISYHPFDCLIKPIDYEKISKCMDRYMTGDIMSADFFRVSSDTSENRISVSEIRYLHGRTDTTIIYTNSGSIETKMKLTDCIKENCFRDFIRIHSTYLVNPVYAEKIGRDYLIISKGIRLPIGNEHSSNVKNYFRKLK
jgi:DNA-binding LytR/AlgR family response regulator